MKKHSKGVKIFALIVSIISVFPLWFVALTLVNNQVEDLSVNEIIDGRMVSVLPLVIIAFFVAGIIPTLILELTNQTKKSVITLILTTVMDFILISEWMTGDKDVVDVTEKLGYGVVAALVAVIVVTLLFIRRASGKK